MSNEKEHPKSGDPGAQPLAHRQPHPAPPPYPPDDDEIDLIELAKTIWDGRKAIFWSVGILVAIGLFVALGTPSQYTSEVKMVPEARGESMGRLGGLARQFGMGGVSEGSEGIPPNLYPDITNSLPLMQQLMAHQVTVERLDTTVTLQTYLIELNPANPVSVAKRYTIGLPRTLLSTVIGWFRTEEEQEPETGQQVLLQDPVPIVEIIRLNRQQWEMVRALRGRINSSYDDRSGTINVRVEMADPEVAAEVAHQVVLFLTEYITAYRTEKAQQNLAFIEGRHIEARQRFQRAQRELAEFTDRHRDTRTAIAEIEAQRLQSEYNMAFSIYNSMAERLEEARITLQEETPVVNVIEPAAVPDRRSSPQRALIMIVSVMLGGIIGVGIVFGKKMVNSAREQWKIQ